MNIDELRSVRKLYDMRQLLGMPNSKRVIMCPLPGHLHHSNTPSFSVFTGKDGVQRFHCFGNCNKQGDIIDLVGYMKIPGYKDHDPKDIMQAINYLVSSGVEIKEPQKIERPAELNPTEWKKYVPAGHRVVNYLRERGLFPETVEKFKIGEFQNAMTIPCFEGGILKAIKCRTINKKIFFNIKGSVKSLFNHDTVLWSDEPILVLKGEIPVMMLDQMGFLACCVTGGEASDIEPWKYVFSFSKKVVVVGDNDADPEINARMQAKMMKKAEILGGEFRTPPPKYKDIDEWLLAEPMGIETVRSWLR